MTRLRGAIGRKVVSRETAETIGHLQGVLLDVASRRVIAVQVGKGRGARVADWSAVTGMGPDAVVVATEGSLREPSHEREQRFVKGDVAVLDGRVLSDRGNLHGSLDDLELDDSTGEVVALLAGDHQIGGSRLLAIGGYAIVVQGDGGDGGDGTDGGDGSRGVLAR